MLQEDLFSALRNHDFEAVASLAEELGRQNVMELQATSTPEERAAVYQKSTAFISDALHLAQVFRAHIATELHANTASFLYENADLEQHRWRIKA